MTCSPSGHSCNSLCTEIVTSLAQGGSVARAWWTARVGKVLERISVHCQPQEVIDAMCFESSLIVENDNIRKWPSSIYVGRTWHFWLSAVHDWSWTYLVILARHPSGQRWWDSQFCVRNSKGDTGQDGSCHSKHWHHNEPHPAIRGACHDSLVVHTYFWHSQTRLSLQLQQITKTSAKFSPKQRRATTSKDIVRWIWGELGCPTIWFVATLFIVCNSNEPRTCWPWEVWQHLLDCNRNHTWWFSAERGQYSNQAGHQEGQAPGLPLQYQMELWHAAKNLGGSWAQEWWPWWYLGETIAAIHPCDSAFPQIFLIFPFVNVHLYMKLNKHLWTRMWVSFLYTWGWDSGVQSCCVEGSIRKDSSWLTLC